MWAPANYYGTTGVQIIDPYYYGKDINPIEVPPPGSLSWALIDATDPTFLSDDVHQIKSLIRMLLKATTITMPDITKTNME